MESLATGGIVVEWRYGNIVLLVVGDVAVARWKAILWNGLGKSVGAVGNAIVVGLERGEVALVVWNAPAGAGQG